MNYPIADYTFWGLYNGGDESEDTPLRSLVYLVTLVDSPKNALIDLEKAKFILRWLFDAEEQTGTSSELLALQNDKNFPQGCFPQTPVMATLRWSPISAMLEHGLDPIVLVREAKRRACASGIWNPNDVELHQPLQECKTPEDLFWQILKKASEKAKNRSLLLNIIAMPGWSYDDNVDRPYNLTLLEAEKADRVIWQRTPRQKTE